MIRNVSADKLRVLVHQTTRLGANSPGDERPGASSPKPWSPPDMPPSRGSRSVGADARPLYTVADETRYVVKNGEAKIFNAGHIQAQVSDDELKRFARMARSVGHGPMPDAVGVEPAHVSARLTNGLPFSVKGIKAPAKRASQDRTMSREKASHVTDHGEMTDPQCQRYLQLQEKPLFDEYETSGKLGKNCVFGYAKLMGDVLDRKIEEELHPHTTPQEMASMTASWRTVP